MKVNELTPSEFSKEVMPSLSDEEYQSLKKSIEKDGIRQPIDATPEGVILDGNHRWEIAKKLGIEEIPVNIIELDSDSEKKKWVINANLLRRQLSTEEKYLLYAELSKQHEKGRGGDRRSDEFQSRQTDGYENKDVLEKTAEEANVSPKTVERARKYSKIIERKPELKGKPVTSVIYRDKWEKDQERRKELRKEVKEKEVTFSYPLDEDNLPVEVFYGCASSQSRKVVKLMETKKVMINYATMHNEPWDSIEKLFIDCGGYSFFHKFGEYQTSDREYLEYIEKVQPDMWALRDYPCESSILRRHGTNVDEQIERTVDNHANLCDLLDDWDLDGEIFSVVQGWEPKDYEICIDMMRDRGIPLKNVGIGSVCGRDSSEDVVEIIRRVSNEADPQKLHTFGVKTDVLQFEEARSLLTSTDSQAFEFSSMYTHFPLQRMERTILSFLNFKKSILRTLTGIKSDKEWKKKLRSINQEDRRITETLNG